MKNYRIVVGLWVLTALFLLFYLIFQIVTAPYIRKLGVIDFNIRELNTLTLLLNSDLSLFKTHSNLVGIGEEKPDKLVPRPSRIVVLHQYSDSYEASR